MRIREVSQATGLTEKSIRLYEQQNLIFPACEERNGRIYRDYSPEDVAELRRIATLRKARFTIAEIRMMQEQPEMLPAIYENYLTRLRTESEALVQLEQLAEALPPEGLENHAALADALEAGAASLPLPRRDVQPHFGKFDPETPEERAAGFAAYEQRQKVRKRHLWLTVAVACLVLVAGTWIAARIWRSMDENRLEAFLDDAWPEEEAESLPELMELLHAPFSGTNYVFDEGAGILLDADGEIVLTAEPFLYTEDIYTESGATIGRDGSSSNLQKITDPQEREQAEAELELLVLLPDDGSLANAIESYGIGTDPMDEGMVRSGDGVSLVLCGTLEDGVFTLAEVREYIRDEEGTLLWSNGEDWDTAISAAVYLYLQSSQDWLYLADELEPESFGRTGTVWDTIFQYRRTVAYQGETYEVVYYGHNNYLVRIFYNFWSVYVVVLMLFGAVLIYRRGTGKSFLVTRSWHPSGKFQAPADQVIIRDDETGSVSVYGSMGPGSGGSFAYSDEKKGRGDHGAL